VVMALPERRLTHPLVCLRILAHKAGIIRPMFCRYNKGVGFYFYISVSRLGALARLGVCPWGLVAGDEIDRRRVMSNENIGVEGIALDILVWVDFGFRGWDSDR
jgi:hypothetical protein